ncbi:HD domain-containing protein [Desulfobacula sp.]
MNNQRVKKFKTWFKEYVSGFYGDDQVQNQIYLLKEAHTLRVCDNILALGKSIHLSPEELNLVQIAALFHDIGRFTQYQVYGTFNDKNSANHAKLGLQQLCSHKILNGLALDEKRFILTPIAWHNAYKLPHIKNNKILLFIKLLRDADKLDIWKVVIDHYTKEDKKGTITILLDLPENGHGYSKKIINALYAGQLAQSSDLTCLTDLKLLQISWVYDLNFTESFRRLHKLGFIEKLGQTLPETKQIKGAVKIAIRYIKKMAAL